MLGLIKSRIHLDCGLVLGTVRNYKFTDGISEGSHCSGIHGVLKSSISIKHFRVFQFSQIHRSIPISENKVFISKAAEITTIDSCRTRRRRTQHGTARVQHETTRGTQLPGNAHVPFSCLFVIDCFIKSTTEGVEM